MVSARFMCFLGLGISAIPPAILAIPRIEQMSLKIRSNASRIEALRQVGNFYQSDRCYSVENTGTPVVKGAIISNPFETSCYQTTDGKSFFFVTKNGETNQVQVSEVFSLTELNNHLSAAQSDSEF